MKHRNHMIPCVIIALIAIAFLSTRGSISLGAGAGVALLLCPLVMGTVMWLLMRRPDGSAPNSGPASQRPRSASIDVERPLDDSSAPTALTNPSTWRQS